MYLYNTHKNFNPSSTVAHQNTVMTLKYTAANLIIFVINNSVQDFQCQELVAFITSLQSKLYHLSHRCYC
jgi:hypothetical protein